MIHKDYVPGYKGKMTDLAEEIRNLRYDALARLLFSLQEKIMSDGKADLGRKRRKLAKALFLASGGLGVASKAIERAWVVSSPYMDLKAYVEPKN